MILASPGFWGGTDAARIEHPSKVQGDARESDGEAHALRKIPKSGTFRRRRYVPGLAPSKLPRRGRHAAAAEAKGSAAGPSPAFQRNGMETAGMLLWHRADGP